MILYGYHHFLLSENVYQTYNQKANGTIRSFHLLIVLTFCSLIIHLGSDTKYPSTTRLFIIRYLHIMTVFSIQKSTTNVQKKDFSHNI